MKTAFFLILFAVAGLVFIAYATTNLSPLNFEKLATDGKISSETTHTEAVKIVEDLYAIGELDQYLRRDAVVLLLIGIFFTCFGVISSLHIVIEKLFFRKFFEQPQVFLGIRRGLLFATLILLLIVFAWYGYLNFGLLVLIIATYVLAEISLSAIIPRRNAIISQDAKHIN